MEIVNAIIGVAGCLIDPVKKELGYMISYKKNVSKVKERNHQLKNTKTNVENHVDNNKSSNVYISAGVPDWLKKVEDINTLVESFPSDVGSCSLKIRHDIGKKALEIIEDINDLIDEGSNFNWNGPGIPLGKVGSMKASTSTPSSHHKEFGSREETFQIALEALESNHESHMVALCGMGGVGKTTMMEKLKKVVTERKLFNFTIQATVGKKTDSIAIQKAVSVFLGVTLIEGDKATRACQLRTSFEARSNEGKKFLIVLDDVWEFVDLRDIGLSPLPNQGVGFKILLTSRDRRVCIHMGVELDSVLDVKLLTVQEAKNFFFQFARTSEDVDLALRNIGDEIASRCQGLPIALKTIALTLKGKPKGVWEDALSRLNHRQLDELDECLHRIFEMSYDNLQEEETRSTLLLCGLLHKELDTSKEDLVMYGWGLSLFSNVDTIQDARNRLSTHIERLVDANLLIRNEDDNQCIKMHDLVRDFVLRMCSKGEHVSIVGDMSKWPTKDTSDSCKRISLTCAGMSEFPRDRKYPNLLLLRLIHGDESLEFHDDFYQEMGKLKVLAYERMACQMTLTSLRCSINLRTLCFDRCFRMIDFSPIGDLFNLEVLSITYCYIQQLPSAIGNLRKLKLLDLKGTTPCIEDGVLENLVDLEELYMKHDENIGPTEAPIYVNYDELATCSKNLVRLEMEFLYDIALPEGMSFKKLKRFKISLGCSFEAISTALENRFSVEKILCLVAEKYQILEFGTNELLIKTDMLHVQVNDVRDGLLESLYPHHSSFYNLKVLEIEMCVELRYLFTVGVANGLTRLEYLEVSSCPVLETLLDTENSGVEAIKFQSLKFLLLSDLPKLESFCNNINLIELPRLEELELYRLPNFTSIYPDHKPTSSMSNETSAMQPLLNKQIVIPRLKKIKISEMENLKQIWASNDGEVRVSLLKEIKITRCESLVNLFPSNPMSSLLQHLEALTVMNCGSIDVVFNIDLGRVGEIEEVNSKLKSIYLERLENLTEIWRVNGENASNRCIMRFQALENIYIIDCESLNRAFPSTTINFDITVTKDYDRMMD